MENDLQLIIHSAPHAAMHDDLLFLVLHLAPLGVGKAR